MKHLISVFDLSFEDMDKILSITKELKDEHKADIANNSLKGKTMAMIFTKSSTRTRVSFEVGMLQLGGHALYLNSNDIQLGRGETIEDTAKILSRYVDAIMIRTASHKDVIDLARFGSVPVINGLTDLMHPCQALADIYTILEKKGQLKGIKLCYIGDGNNVAHSLLHACAKVGMHISVATPPGYECNSGIIEEAMHDAKISGSKIIFTNDPSEAIDGADAVYTDTWVSMGQENEKKQRLSVFLPYQVNPELFSLAKKDAIFMHCLPAYRGNEVAASIIDGPASVVFDEAENRLHVQKAIMTILMI